MYVLIQKYIYKWLITIINDSDWWQQLMTITDGFELWLWQTKMTDDNDWWQLLIKNDWWQLLMKITEDNCWWK